MARDSEYQAEYLENEFIPEDVGKGTDVADKSPSRCINCGINLRTRKLNVDRVMAPLIRKWIFPVQLLPSSKLCSECWHLIQARVIEGSAGEKAERPFGHKHVCVCCGRSLLRQKMYKFDIKNNKCPLIWKDIEFRIAPRESAVCRVHNQKFASCKESNNELTPEDKICRACWMKSGRAVKKLPHNLTPPPVPNNIERTQPTSPVQQESHTTREANAQKQKKEVIVLPNYSRLPHSKICQCIFSECISDVSMLMVVPQCVRVELLNKYKFYVCRKSKICKEHLQKNSWGTLVKGDNVLHTFTVQQIEDMLSFNQGHIIDFSNFGGMSENMVLYWTGFLKNDNMKLLLNVPGLSEMEHGTLGLIAYLTKVHTRDSDQRIAALMNIPLMKMEELLAHITVLIDQSIAPANGTAILNVHDNGD